MSDTAIEFSGVSKHFGSNVALDAVDLVVPRGSIFGFIGPNGAGKTTAIRLLFGLLKADQGLVSVLGNQLPAGLPKVAGTQIGGIIEEPQFYPFLSGRQNLKAFAAGISTRPDYDGLLARVGLTEAADRKVKGYSLGMRQRLGIARALLGDPQILILDEPTNGLDPEGIISFREMIEHMTQHEGRTVFVSSHLLAELEQVCTQVAIVNHGKVLASGTVAELIGTTSQVVVHAGIGQAVALENAGARQVKQQADGSYLISLDDTSEQTLINFNKHLIHNGIPVSQLHVNTRNLEESFLQIIAGSES